MRIAASDLLAIGWKEVIFITESTEPTKRACGMWQDVSPEQWKDWQWQLGHAITSVDALGEVLSLSEQELEGARAATQYLRMRIAPFLVNLIAQTGSEALKKQFVPSRLEIESLDDDTLFEDVNADDKYSPVKGLVHRYPSKALLFPSDQCGCYCRFCFRRRWVGTKDEILSREEVARAIDYVRNTPQLEEVILSGGEPLILTDAQLDDILKQLAQIPHVRILRIHTRLPITIPYRITPELVNTLVKYKPIFMVLHINHPLELTAELAEAIGLLVDNGIPCLSQTALLRGVNDDEATLRTLFTNLVCLRIKPYYLFHSDPVKGLGHFLITLPRGIEIMNRLYDRMSGMAMPMYCFNVPGGYGHVLLGHNYVRQVKEGHYVIETFEKQLVEYKEYIEFESTH